MTTSTISRLGRAPEEGIKAPVKATTLVDITLQGNGFTVGLPAYTVQTGDRILVNAQTIPAENGIYLVGANAWERASDMNADDDVVNGQLVLDANTSNLYQIAVTSPWDPGATAINFNILLGSMPPAIVLTLADPIDLVDTMVALNVGAADPDTEPHIEVDFQSVQSKSDATTAAPLFLNPMGGAVQLVSEMIITAAVPQLTLVESGATADEGRWDFLATTDQLRFRVVDDADTTAADWLLVDRTLNVVDLITLTGPTLFNGNLTVVGTIDADETIGIDGTTPQFFMNETDAGVDQGFWRTLASAEGLFHQIRDDANLNALSYLSVGRSGTGAGINVDSLTFAADTIALNGNVTFNAVGFDAAVAATPAVSANTAKVTNATHTGDVTGSGALTLDVTAITGKAAAGALAGANTMLIQQAGGLFEVDLTTLDAFWTGGGGGTPGGADTQVQYNNGGAFGGIAEITWDDTLRRYAHIDSVQTTSFYSHLIQLNALTSGTALRIDIGQDGNLTTGNGIFVIANVGGGNSAGACVAVNSQNDTSGLEVTMADGGYGLYAYSASTARTLPLVYLEYDDGSPGATILQIQNDASDNLSPSIELTGNVGGIRFGATARSTEVNTLDDYEEGTAAMTMAPNSGTVTIDTSQDLISYTKIGRMVFFHGRLDVASVSSPLGSFQIDGLPFTVSSSPAEGADRVMCQVALVGIAGSGDSTVGLLDPGFSRIAVWEKSGGTLVAFDSSNLNAGDGFYVTGHYITDQ